VDEEGPDDLTAMFMGFEATEDLLAHEGQLERAEWVDETTEYNCVAFLNPLRFYVGYVEIPDGHCWHGLDYGLLEDFNEVDVHGGVTFSGLPLGCTSGHWLGFDCGHAWDGTPYIDRLLERYMPGRTPHGTFRTLDFVKNECGRLASQIQMAYATGKVGR